MIGHKKGPLKRPFDKGLILRGYPCGAITTLVWVSVVWVATIC